MLLKHLIAPARLLRRAPLRVMASRAASSPASSSSSGCSPFADGGSHCTMNDMPIPEGDWNEWYARRNGKNTVVLVAGIVSFLGSLIMFFSTDRVVWNYNVPEYDD